MKEKEANDGDDSEGKELQMVVMLSIKQRRDAADVHGSDRDSRWC